jgi:hypothetical protein
MERNKLAIVRGIIVHSYIYACVGKSNKTGNVRKKRNNEALSCNHCCHGKAISITYCECVSVALVIQHAKRMRRIILSCGLSGCTIFLHIIS